MDELTSKQKELERYKRYRDSKRYIIKLADLKDLQEVQRWLDNRMAELKD